MSDRRSVYFMFQGLLMAVLLLLFLFEPAGIPHWTARLGTLIAATGSSLAFLKLAPGKIIDDRRFQMGLFLGDAALASVALGWMKPDINLYLLYFIIIFGTSLIRNFAQSAVVALTCSAFYLVSSVNASRGLSDDPGFWLRLLFLWIAAAVLAILSKDIRESEKDREKRYRQKLVSMESLASLGQLAGEVAHRIKGPLTTILVNAEVLAQRHARSKEARKELDQIQNEVARCKDILKNLLALGRIEETDLVSLDLRDCLNSAVESMKPRFKKRDVRFEARGMSAPLPARGDPSLLHEAVAAVLQNAADAVGAGGRISLDVRPIKRRLWWPTPGTIQEAYEIAVEDNGRGIDREDLPHIFQPFFTTKRDGSGLGLPAALRILQKHGGAIETASDGPGRGARFTIILPKNPR